MRGDVEALLARYRPSGPPPGLRDRVVVPRRRTWPWVAAAAALLLATGAVSLATEALAGRAGGGVGGGFTPHAVSTHVGDEAAEWAAIIAQYERFLAAGSDGPAAGVPE